MSFKKTIKIFLVDGDPNGRLSCELSNWSGKAYKIPRTNVKDCSDRSDLQNTGVYLLFGKGDFKNPAVYIGEAESIIVRLNQHLAQKDFWHEAIVFLNKDENLNKAHIKFLENRLHDLAINAKRYEVFNSKTPTQSSLSESDKAEMEEYIENIKLLVNTLGHKLFDEIIQPKSKQNEQKFYIKSVRGTDAQGGPSPDGFVVFKGSKAAISTVDSFSTSFVNFRQSLIAKGILKNCTDYFEFSEDYIFSSPSTAAAIVMGRNANGTTEWRMSDDKTLKEFETNLKI